MSRGFTGSRGGTVGSKSAKDIYMKAQKASAKGGVLTQAEQYEQLLAEKMSELKNKATGTKRFSFSLPGTDSGAQKELSASAKQVLEKMAVKKAKEEMKKREKKRGVVIVPKYLTGMYGGRIDSDGRIYANGAVIASINKKTGEVRDKKGTFVCKYKGTSFDEFKISRFIAEHCVRVASGNTLWGTGSGSAPAISPGNFWGNHE